MPDVVINKLEAKISIVNLIIQSVSKGRVTYILIKRRK